MPNTIATVTKLVNISLKHWTVAKSQKSAIIQPLLKKIGLELTYCNYRPISNLSFMSKIIEKCMLKQFNKHCSTYHLLPEYQSAYWENQSYDTAPIKLVNNVLWSMERKKVTALIAINLSTAFDMVDHNILISVLQTKFGVKGKALDWYKSDLNDRTCKVNVGKEYSTPGELLFSFPQGSCSRSILYLAYSSTIREVNPDNTISLHGFADDHTLHKHFDPVKPNEESEAMQLLMLSTSNIKTWMDQNHLWMNSSKTKFILIGSKQRLAKCETDIININGEPVKLSKGIKYLGAWIDSQLSFKTNINLKCRTAWWNLQKLRLIRNTLTREAAHTIALGLINSDLDHANSLLIRLPDHDINRMQKV